MARRARHATHNSHLFPYTLSRAQHLHAVGEFRIRTLHPQIRSSAATDSTQTLYISSIASPQATFWSSPLNSSISKSYDQNNFPSFYYLKMHQKTHIIFELFLQFSRSPGSPVCKPSHMGKCMLKLLFKIDQNPYFHQNMNIWSAIWDGLKTGEPRIAKTIRSKSTQAPNKKSSKL